MSLLTNKNILVTGGSRGIGAGIVKAAMQEGANVAFTYLNSVEEAESIVEEMVSKHPEQRCLAQQCDVADTDIYLPFLSKTFAENPYWLL